MAEIKINCPFDFSLHIERILRESKNVPNKRAKDALEEFAMYCFELGFKAGKVPENHPRYKINENG